MVNSYEIVNGEPEAKSTVVASTGTDTQIMRVPHPDPAAARIIWTKLYIHNTAAAVAEVLFWDEDLTAGAISTSSKQGANAAGTARFRVTIAADSQIILDTKQLPCLKWQAGIACRTDAASTLVVVEWLKQVS